MNKTEQKSVTLLFAGDSGDGMQITGAQFTLASAVFGNALQTLPDFPAEIRAPAGTPAGVSGFQICFSDEPVLTPGDQVDTLIAMNPAALKANLSLLKPGANIFVDQEKFTKRDLQKSGYAADPLTDGSLDAYQVFAFPMSSLTLEVVSSFELTHAQGRKCKNMFALGVAAWIYDRKLDIIEDWLKEKFAKQKQTQQANLAALKAGYNFALTSELLESQTEVAPAKRETGNYRQITGNQACVLGCVAAAHRFDKGLLAAGYPITPASDVLQQLAQYSDFGVRTFQAEDEMAAVGAAIGASFAGQLAFTCTSGPGFDLKAESVGLAVMTELPLVILNVQRAGPSTGLPTKTEQADLLMAMYGRHGECPVPILAPATPSDCFDIMLKAFEVATKYMTPVVVLTDAYIANGASPWRIPDVENIPSMTLKKIDVSPEAFKPYARDPDTLARPWVPPGTPGYMHRIGGLEKDSETGDVSYDPDNHEKMVCLREDKVAKVAECWPALEIEGSPEAATLVVSWGSTYGTVSTAIAELNTRKSDTIAHVHLRHLNPFPGDLGAILKRYQTILVPELNRGQLSKLLRAEYLVNAIPISKVKGKPFLVHELCDALEPHITC